MIRWTLITQVAKEIATTLLNGTEISIHLSSDVPENIRANIQSKDGKHFDVLLNASRNKREYQIIESLAHELAHIVYIKHNKKHKQTQSKIYRQFKNRIMHVHNS